jgi:hypothetical protein
MSLFAIDSSENERVTRDIAGTTARPWKYIYIHHSKTADGAAQTLASGDLGDHFVICNGDGGGDGEVQGSYRWTKQLSGVAPRGAKSIAADCISICLVGDFDATRPTAQQIRNLSQLVALLQSKYAIPAGNIYMASQGNTAAGIGRYFPAQEFRRQIQAEP